MYHTTVNVNLIIENVTRNGIMKHANVSVRTIKRAKHFIAGIIAYMFVRIVGIEAEVLTIQ